MPIELSDAELVNALLQGRPDAPRLVIERFGPLVRGVLVRGLGSSDELEDAQQNVFLSLFHRIPTLRDPESLRPFVLAITLKTVLHERRRRQKRNRMLLEREPMAADSGTGSDAGASLAFTRLAGLLARLSERDRTTFVLRFVERRTTDEVAEVLGMSAATARRSFSRAWRRIRKWASKDPFLSDYVQRRPRAGRREQQEPR